MSNTDILTTLTTEIPLSGAKARSAPKWDVLLFSVVVVLVAFGLVMLYSASAVKASMSMGDHMQMLRSQGWKVAVGFALMFVAMHVDYRILQRHAVWIMGGALSSLVVVLIVGVAQKGATRWLNIAGISVQPAEFVKFATIVWVAAYVSNRVYTSFGLHNKDWWGHMAPVAVCGALLLKQPDFGTTAIIGLIAIGLLFVSGMRLTHVGVLVALAGCLGWLAITSSEYRMKRITAFRDPWAAQQGDTYQISQSLIAIGQSGLGGRGLGSGTGKLGYVPELWNDFISTIVAEELGILGFIALVALFLMLMWRGMRIAWRAVDPFGRYLAIGLTGMFTLQGALNLLVVTGMAPTKGLTLPFVSYGGTSVILAMMSVGILLNISRNNPDPYADKRDERRREGRHRRPNTARTAAIRS